MLESVTLLMAAAEANSTKTANAAVLEGDANIAKPLDCEPWGNDARGKEMLKTYRSHWEGHQGVYSRRCTARGCPARSSTRIEDEVDETLFVDSHTSLGRQVQAPGDLRHVSSARGAPHPRPGEHIDSIEAQWR